MRVPEELSFCFPEQERGSGSQSSIESLLSQSIGPLEAWTLASQMIIMYIEDVYIVFLCNV